MTKDTIFDLASLTKVIATTSAIMLLVERGQIKLNEPAATYFPETNVLVPVRSVAEKSNTPTSKSVVISIRAVGIDGKHES